MFNTEREDHLMEVINKKTGNRYYVDDVVIDSTNDLEIEEQVKVLYSNDKAEKFVREANEFFEKFDIPSGFNILSKACELALQNVKKFHNTVMDECQCEKEYIGEMIDVDVYKTYRQQKESCWYVPRDIIKEKAYKQLKELFNRRCYTFDIVKKEYDNATSDYFLVGYKEIEDYPKNPIQICKIPKTLFLELLGNEEEDL